MAGSEGSFEQLLAKARLGYSNQLQVGAILVDLSAMVVDLQLIWQGNVPIVTKVDQQRRQEGDLDHQIVVKWLVF